MENTAVPTNPAACSSSSSQGTERPPWRKVLYQQQPYADWYTGDSFLEDLVVNAVMPQRAYGAVAWSTLAVDQQVSTVAAVGGASFHLYQGSITPGQLLLVDVLLVLVGAMLYLLSSALAASGADGAAKGKAAERAASARGSEAAAAGYASWQDLPAKTQFAPPQPESCVLTCHRSRHLPNGTNNRKPGVYRTVGTGSKYLQNGTSDDRMLAKLSRQHQQTHASAGSRQSGKLHAPQSHAAAAAAGPPSWRQACDFAGSASLMAAATALLSPLLATLTANVSSDSVLACACALLLAHLYLHDYHFTSHLTAHVSASLALSCAVCSSVLIASRLASTEAVCAQLLLSLEMYLLGPYCRRQVAAASPAAHLALTLAMAAAAAALLAPLSVLLTSSLCCLLLFITFVCPMWLLRIQKYKAQINGPWDEAVPHLSCQLPLQ